MATRAHKVRLCVFVWLVQVHLAPVAGSDKNMTRVVNFKTGDVLRFELSFKNFPKLPAGQIWTSTVYKSDTKNRSSAPELMSTMYHSVESLKHVLDVKLEASHDKNALFVKVENYEAEEYYQEEFIYLQHRQYNTGEKDDCLNKCNILFNIWKPKIRRRLLMKPELNNVTYYQIGDRFSHNCTSTGPKRESVVLTWSQRKAGGLEPVNTSSVYSSIDIVLDESYNNTDVQCRATYRPAESDPFEDIFFDTKLILRPLAGVGPARPAAAVPWYAITTIVVVISVAVLAALGYFGRIRRRYHKEHEYDYIMEVQNDLYAPYYSQPYEQRPLPAPPAPARVLYANTVGSLQ